MEKDEYRAYNKNFKEPFRLGSRVYNLHKIQHKFILSLVGDEGNLISTEKSATNPMFGRFFLFST